MSAYASLFKQMESSDELAPTALQTLKDFFNGELGPIDAAKQYNENIYMHDELSRQFHLSVLTIFPIQIGSIPLQVNVTKLLSELILLWGGETFGDLEFVIRQSYDSKHVFRNFQSTLILNLGLYARANDPRAVEDHRAWININQLYARLTASGLCDCPFMARDVCGILLEDPVVRENPTLFALNISAGAQLMIYAGLDVYTYCQEKIHSIWEGRPASGWNDWKATFRKASKFEDTKASKHALMAVMSMNRAEWAYHCNESMVRSIINKNISLGTSTAQASHTEPRVNPWDEAEGQ